MPKISPNDTLQARCRAAADQKALDAVIRHSDLRGEQAARVARHAVAAAAPDLRTMYAQKMGGTTTKQATAAGLVVTAAVVTELAAYVALFRQGGPKTKALAGAAVAFSLGIFAYGRVKQQQIRQAAIAELARGEVKAA